MHIVITTLLGALWLLAGSAHAHTDEYLDTLQAPHGGQLRMAGAFHFELVVQGNTLTVYLTDHGNTPLASAGGSGYAILLSSKGKARIPLSPAGNNELRGSGDFTIAPDLVVALSYTPPGQPTQLARFTPYRKLSAAATPPHDHDAHPAPAHDHDPAQGKPHTH